MTERTGCLMRAASSWVKAHSPTAGKLAREERIRVGGGLVESPRELGLDDAAIVFAAHGPEETIDGSGLITSLVDSGGRPKQLEERGATGNVKQRGFQQR
jgi:hypothetical protein